ncbi:MAG TPA: helix-turn-helix domain-containing protein [Methylophilaceae bacterium]|nr:helix-turn-helix domain-containing protein [Methylophilaceae bacterium]
MSIKVMTAIFDRYPNGGGEMVLALALADHSDDEGQNIYPSIKRLAIRTRQSERTVQYQLRKMEEAGWLMLVAHGTGGRDANGRGYPREYRINPAWLKGAEIAPIDQEKGAKVAPQRVQSTTPRVQSDAVKGAIAVAPKPSLTIIEPSEEKSSAQQARTTANNGTRLTLDSIPEEWAAWATEAGMLPGRLQTTWETFRDYWQSAAGAKGRKADWFATWRNWVRREQSSRPGNQQRPNSPYGHRADLSGMDYTAGVGANGQF